jgi:hypothetical protein
VTNIAHEGCESSRAKRYVVVCVEQERGKQDGWTEESRKYRGLYALGLRVAPWESLRNGRFWTSATTRSPSGVLQGLSRTLVASRSNFLKELQPREPWTRILEHG